MLEKKKKIRCKPWTFNKKINCNQNIQTLGGVLSMYSVYCLFLELVWVTVRFTDLFVELQGEEADDDDIYNVLSTLKRLTAFHKYELLF